MFVHGHCAENNTASAAFALGQMLEARNKTGRMGPFVDMFDRISELDQPDLGRLRMAARPNRPAKPSIAHGDSAGVETGVTSATATLSSAGP